ncbi:hypothetical protein JL722_2517 [Aureococcus anophagefferens]|nr:hypothetical protein JL722_2517 [Aureococcus anophagefferens]
MLSSSLDISSTSLERARKRHRFRNPWYDRRFAGAIRCALVVAALLSGTMFLRTSSAARAAESLDARLHPLLLSRDDDAQYAEERRTKKRGDAKKQAEPAVCETGLMSAPGDVRACCAPHCGSCDSACGDAACCAPAIIETGLVCRGPFDSQCVWARDAAAHLEAVATSGMMPPRGEATDYELDPRSPLATAASLEDLEAIVAELPVSRRRAYVLHMDPAKYQLGDPGRGSYPLAPQLSYLPKRFVVHLGMRLRLRDNTVVLALGGAVTGTRIYCAYVDDESDVKPTRVMLTPFTSVTDIVAHDDADVRAAAAAYRALWRANPVIKEVQSTHWNEHRTFERAG